MGEQNFGKLRKLVGITMKVITGISVLTVAASFLLTRPLVSVFARPDNLVYDLAVTGNRICTAALFFGVNGIWLATPVAELMALALSAFMFLNYRKRYGY